MSVFEDMNQVFDCIFTRPYADDTLLANELVDRLTFLLSKEMFKHQEEVCYMISEKNPPMLKDNVIEYMQNCLNTKFGWIRNYIICRMLISYRMSNVDLGESGERYLREEFTEEEWEEFNQAMNRYVWDDYCKFFGPEKTKEHFEKINRPEFIPNDVRENKIKDE
jgi:hypothetical protein